MTRTQHLFYTDRRGVVHPISSAKVQPGAGAGAIDNPQKFAPSGPGSSPVYAGGRHIGYVYKSGRGWWAEYMGERRHPSPYRTKQAAVEAVERTHRARHDRG